MLLGLVVEELEGGEAVRERVDRPLAGEIVQLLTEDGLVAAVDGTRGMDHGAWVPLHFMYPSADLPVVQVSLPSVASPAELVRLGHALAPLRERNVLIVGSGGVVHNLRRIVWHDSRAPVENWAQAFDELGHLRRA